MSFGVWKKYPKGIDNSMGGFERRMRSRMSESITDGRMNMHCTFKYSSQFSELTTVGDI